MGTLLLHDSPLPMDGHVLLCLWNGFRRSKGKILFGAMKAFR